MYESQITFTLDTICPWTYLAKKRLDAALASRAPAASSKVNFTLRIAPYQLYPNFGPPQDKHGWQRDAKHLGSEEEMARYTALLTRHGEACGVRFRFGGVIADTLQAHRVIQYFQTQQSEGVAAGKEGEEGAAEGPARGSRGSRIVDALYRMYFEEEQDPSAADTLVAACVEAGVAEEEARRVVEDESEGLAEVKALLRESAMNGIDSVPHIVFEGRRRDITLVGAKDVEAYVKAMETIAKESV